MHNDDEIEFNESKLSDDTVSSPITDDIDVDNANDKKVKVSSDNIIQAYFASIRHIPLLTQEEEFLS